MKSRLVTGSVLALVLAAGMPSSRAADLVYASGPGEQFRGYTLPVLVIPQGTKVSYANVDVSAHTVTADVYGGPQPWCAPTQKYCPLFDSSIVVLGQVGPIYGIDLVPPGSYPFKCIYHSAQKGTLRVV